MSKREQIVETRLHTLKGEYPVVDTYSHVDTNLLYEGDENPFHVTLPIMEIGRVSLNGLVYDEELVSSVEAQLATGADGIGGHVPDDRLSTDYPVAEVYWIGHKREGNITWAKGYVPPGSRRDDIRRKKANGGTVGTSIFGSAVREAITNSPSKKRWKARNFELDTLDFAPAKRASLRMNRGFAITRETENLDHQEGTMPEQITLADVPQPVREQIIREASEVAELRTKAAQVDQATSRIAELESQVKELARWQTIVTEIRSTLGADVDPVKVLTDNYRAATKLAEMLGVDFSNITVRVEAMHQQVAELEQSQFETNIDAQVAELTKWQVVGEENLKKLAAFRQTVKRAILREMGEGRDNLAEVAKKVWDEDFKIVAESMVLSFAGPGAIVNGTASAASGDRPNYRTDEGRKALLKNWGYN